MWLLGALAPSCVQPRKMLLLSGVRWREKLQLADLIKKQWMNQQLATVPALGRDACAVVAVAVTENV